MVVVVMTVEQLIELLMVYPLDYEARLSTMRYTDDGIDFETTPATDVYRDSKMVYIEG